MLLKTLMITSVLVVAGVLHGLLSDRWGPPAMVREAGARLESLPDDIAGWTATRFEVSERMLQAAGASNVINREYRLLGQDQALRVVIVCGRPGPVSLHPPTVCFPGSGLKQASPVESIRWEDQQFARCLFADPSSGLRLLTYWGWSPDAKTWTVPEHPRLTFAHQRRLYKLYLMSTVNTETDLTPQQREFVQEFLREIGRIAL